MSIKLNSRIRMDITNLLLSRKYAQQEKRLEEAKCQLAEDIYKDVFGEDIRKMNRLPEGWLPVRGHVAASIAGDYEQLKFGKKVEKRFPHSKAGSCLKRYEATSPIAERFRQIKNAESDLNEGKRRLRAEINAVLNSATTAASLVKKWPEVQPIVEKVTSELVITNLPAVRLDSLNHELKLHSASVA